MEASGSPPRYLFYCLNLLAEFDKLYPSTLNNWTLEDQTDYKKITNESLRDTSAKKLKLQDGKITRKRDLETHQK